MAESPTLTLYYFILGDNPNLISSVKIEATKTVYALKEVILAKHGSRFSHILVEELGLWAVSIPGDETFAESIKKLNPEHPHLPPLKRLSNIFQDPLDPERVHLIVIPPPPLPEPVSLNCCFIGCGSSLTFVVEIEATKSVDALAEVIGFRIKNKPGFDTINGQTIQLWKTPVPVPADQDAIKSIEKLTLPESDCLYPLGELSEVFPDSPLRKHIHIVAKPQPPKLDLKCYVLGDRTNLIFSVEIEATNTIDTLKEAIHVKSSPRFDHIEAHTLQIWNVSIPIDRIVKKTGELSLVDQESLRSPDKLSEILLDSPPGHVHIVVKPPPPAVDDTLHPLQAACTNSYKSRKKGSPSSLGTPDKFATLHFACARPPKQEPALPLALMDPIFANFIQDCGTVKPTKEAYECAFKLRAAMNKFYPNEATRGHKLREVLEAFGIKLVPGPIKTYTTDGHFLYKRRPICILELKNEIGSQGAEPSLQILLYYDEFIQDDSLAADVCSIHPCFAITLAGPRIAFAGCALTDRSTLETFSGIALDFHSTDNSAYLNLARHLTALKTALDGLYHRYSEAAPRPALVLRVPSPDHPAPTDPIFPHPTTFTRLSDGNTIPFKYVAGLEGRALLFEGRTEHFHHICIKFVRQYGVAAHKWCAEHGFAPKLLGFETLPGGWFMVVMEMLDSNSWTTLDEARGDNAALKERILDSIVPFHQNHMVHGDIRYTNVMVKKGDKPAFMLIDFDWAGLVGKVEYPPFINLDPLLRRPSGVSYGSLILPEHDIIMIGNMFL